ncbi:MULTISPECIES: hypothetical protein [Aneurinibacillus]|jgi:hypothetical protein|uniref:GyrI-like small molecule binding domain-containing protein n=1 Tax=Aneurinibacillus thermoaerophilus TaxID=143495 RepID=A0ABX8YDJ0_ANETH|nr:MULTISPECIES: hypothetical protein [Aneurinibacillus]AMA74031.1 hypothetical protein ACH33_15075 [Aneurinibacillus sp. XH2]MED0737232.1 hypothetical protein [Aneurinibacillus thermoaerophilus]QYY43384.1 hypothetical protein K3F53_03790 [Aneurinibacillus thermoaerophilus]
MIGKASSIKVVHITRYSYDGKGGFDGAINRWLSENAEVEVLDIKFSSSATQEDTYEDALIIYKPAQ